MLCVPSFLIDINITKGFVIQKYNYIKPKIEKYENTFENKNKERNRRKRENRRKERKQRKERSLKKMKKIHWISHLTLLRKDLRHCLIEQFQNDDTYVANDICFDSRQQGVLLFGTNAIKVKHVL